MTATETDPATVATPANVRVIIQQKALLLGIERVMRAVSAKPTLPILGNLLVEYRPESRAVRLSGYDLEIGLRTEVPVESGAGAIPAALCLPCKMFREFVKNFSAGELALSFTPDGDCVIAGPRKHHTLRGAPVEDWPDFPELGDGKSWQVTADAATFKRGLERTMYATDKVAMRSFMSGLYLEDNDGLRLVATDGRRMALDTLPATFTGKGRMAMLPMKNIEDFYAAALGKITKGQQVIITFTPKLTRLECGDVLAITHNLDAQMPDVDRIIPRDFKGSIEVNRLALLDAITSCALTAKQVEGRDMVILETDGDELTVSAKVDNRSQSRYVLEVAREGQDCRMAFNYQYLLDICKSTPADTLRMQYNGQVDPGYFTVPGDTCSALLMPVRMFD